MPRPQFDAITQKDYYQLYAYFNQAIPEVAQRDVDMFKKYFIGRELTVCQSKAAEEEAEELRQALTQLENGAGTEDGGIAAEGERAILEFERTRPVIKNNTTHPAETSMVKDAPEGAASLPPRPS